MNIETVMIVYAYDIGTSGVWIYGAYRDQVEGFNVMKEMQESEEYGHLIWSNNIIKLN